MLPAPWLLITQRSWDEAFSKSKDTSDSLVRERETRLANALQDLETTRKELKGAREEAGAAAVALEEEREALSHSRARTNELHKLGVDMERELTAMLEGDWTAFSFFLFSDPIHQVLYLRYFLHLRPFFATRIEGIVPWQASLPPLRVPVGER